MKTPQFFAVALSFISLTLPIQASALLVQINKPVSVWSVNGEQATNKLAGVSPATLDKNPWIEVPDKYVVRDSSGQVDLAATLQNWLSSPPVDGAERLPGYYTQASANRAQQILFPVILPDAEFKRQNLTKEEANSIYLPLKDLLGARGLTVVPKTIADNYRRTGVKQPLTSYKPASDKSPRVSKYVLAPVKKGKINADPKLIVASSPVSDETGTNDGIRKDGTSQLIVIPTLDSKDAQGTTATVGSIDFSMIAKVLKLTHEQKDKMVCTPGGSSAFTEDNNACSSVRLGLAPLPSRDYFRKLSDSERSDKFVEWLKPAALYVQTHTGIPASVIIAQAAVETGYGKSKLFVEGYNMFGLTCVERHSEKSLTIKFGSESQTTMAGKCDQTTYIANKKRMFGKYNDPLSSMMLYLHNLLTGSHYTQLQMDQQVLRTQNPTAVLSSDKVLNQLINYDGPGYKGLVKKVIRDNGLEALDSHVCQKCIQQLWAKNHQGGRNTEVASASRSYQQSQGAQ